MRIALGFVLCLGNVRICCRCLQYKIHERRETERLISVMCEGERRREPLFTECHIWSGGGKLLIILSEAKTAPHEPLSRM